MLKRKIGLMVVILLVSLFFTPKKIYAGTCSCAGNQSGGVYLAIDNCENDEYASGCTGSPRNMASYEPNCTCVKKETTGENINTCTCSNSGQILTNHCQGDTPFPYCNTRSSVFCRCYKEDLANASTNNSTNEVYNPSCTKDGKEGINTALGCIPVEMGDFIPWLMTWLFGIAGGIAFLLMVYGFILIATSSGDEKKIQGAKETITSAIVGLLVCIFSVFILRLIAVNILKIPGF